MSDTLALRSVAITGAVVGVEGDLAVGLRGAAARSRVLAAGPFHGEGNDMQQGTVYGHRREAQRALYETVTASAGDLRGRLQVLVQLAHTSAQPEDVEAVRAAIWAAHGGRERG